MEIILIGFFLTCLPWGFAFKKLNSQPLGYSIFIKQLIRCLSICIILFIGLYVLAMTNHISNKPNGSGSASPEEIRQAVYIFVGWIIVLIVYASGGIDCYQIAKKRALSLKPEKTPKHKKNRRIK